MRRGYTLVELLVVMIILVILVATMIPLVKMVMEGDRTREATRALSAYVSQAKTQAAVTGRPAGLILMLQSPIGTTDNPAPAPVTRQCTQMFLAEVPPTYQGGVQGARGRIMPSTASPGSYEFVILTPDPMTPGNYIPDTNEMTYLDPLIKDGDSFTVRFDHKGAWYRCHRSGGQFLYDGQTTMGVAQPVPPGMTSTGQHPGSLFTIQRAPAPVGDPLELTGGTCIDLAYSGAGTTGNAFIVNRQSLTIMFSPNGSIQSLYHDGIGPFRPDGTIHLLIGTLSRMELPMGPNLTHPSTMNMFDPVTSNLATADSLWVSIGRQSGKVTSSENVPPPSWTDFTPAGQMAYLEACRNIAIAGEQMTGR